jgi:hypothetical protein
LTLSTEFIPVLIGHAKERGQIQIIEARPTRFLSCLALLISERTYHPAAPPIWKKFRQMDT